MLGKFSATSIWGKWLITFRAVWMRATGTTNTAYYLRVLLAIINEIISSPRHPQSFAIWVLFSDRDTQHVMRLRSKRLHASREVCRGPLAGDNRWWTTESWCQSVKPTLYGSFLMARILTCIRKDVVSSSSWSIYSQIKQRWRLKVLKPHRFTLAGRGFMLCFSTFTWITCYFYCAGVSNAKI